MMLLLLRVPWVQLILALVRNVDIIATRMCMFVCASKGKFCFVIKCMDSVCIYKINQINK